jgi:lysophospholipase L1-like esterase
MFMIAKGFAARRRLAVLLMLGVAAIAAAVAYHYFWLDRSIGKGPAGPAVDRRAFENVWTERRVLLLGLGDSITAGLGARTNAHGCFYRLAKNPHDEFPNMQGLCLSAVLPNLEVKNLAISGTTSLTHVEVLEKSLSPQPPEVLGLVMMTTGGNDLIHYYGKRPPREGAMYGATLEQAQPWIDNFEQRLGRMIDLLDERFPGGCHVFLADIYDPTDGVGDAASVGLPEWPDGLAIHEAYNEAIRRCARRRHNVRMVPLREEFLGHGAHCRKLWRNTYRHEDPHFWYFDNIEDPNDRGHDAIRRVFLNAMAAAREQLAAEPASAAAKSRSTANAP